jgi:hypothetical protein
MACNPPVTRLHASPLMRACGQDQRRCDQDGPADQQHGFPCRLPGSLEAGSAGHTAWRYGLPSTVPLHGDWGRQQVRQVEGRGRADIRCEDGLHYVQGARILAHGLRGGTIRRDEEPIPPHIRIICRQSTQMFPAIPVSIRVWTPSAWKRGSSMVE